ncbi:response regulator [Aestuariivirga sp.]|uniref:response regulator n=1 Tax=Aestuariivirga sp. TaxID=2650926 RepID=UPI003BAAF44E
MKMTDHILIVEDHPVILMAAATMFQDAGFKTLEANCAAAAIAILEGRSDVGLVFTDVNMPGTMDGLKLIAYIRNRWPPIELLVASGLEIVAESQLPAGARFFQKPYAEADIVNTVRALISVPG